MKKRITVVVLSLLLVACAVFVTACGGKEQKEDDTVYQIQNGGFETGDLTGWTVESGNAYSDDCVVSKTDFGFADDGYTARIAFNHTGNWHLYGRAFDDRYESQRVGSLRSQTFTLAGDGTISLKLAGGSLYNKDGNEKPEYAQCFVGVYRASDNRMVARQTNEYFVKHQDGNFDANKYDPVNGSLSTDNYNRYTIHLEEYTGEQLYIRIVDNDPDFYYGYLSVDDVRTYSEAGPQTEGAVFDKIRLYETEVTVPENDVANGGFETGSLAGWTVLEGNAFNHAGVNASPTWWKENITYNRDGAYHYGFYEPTATGRMRSNTFTLSGSGWVTYKLGGCCDNQKTYIAVMEDMGNGVSRELTRVSNHLYKDIQFPYVPNGLKLANMVEYRLDLSAYVGNE
ncbi:MAG: hypothetical protein K2L51_03325, partial [Clostridiales bacterium]|nr:hypothetical protein [Clostridiales bacterium]